MKLPLLLSALVLAPLSVAAQDATVWRHTLEVETWDRGYFGTVDLTTRLGYYDDGQLHHRVEINTGVADSLVYRYNDDRQMVYKADYRGPDVNQLTFYTYDEWEYDPLIADLPIWHVGHQYVDQEWSIYIAEKLGITRDERSRILRIADYTPGDEALGVPDLPVSYVKTFVYPEAEQGQGEALTAYRREAYGMDPVTEEAFLRLEEEWTDIEWEDYAGQVTDPNLCYSGPNRIKAAHVYDDYYGYAYDLSVSYDGPAYIATMDIPSVGQRKLHTLRFTDDYGSFEEEFRTFRIESDGTPVLAFVERVTEEYDDHGNRTLQERALSKSTATPDVLSVRQGKRWTYTYDPLYNDWTARSEQQFYQNYDDDGPDGYYEAVASIRRSDWVAFDLSDPDGIRQIAIEDGAEHSSSSAEHNLTSAESNLTPAAARFTLSGRPAASQRGISIERGRKTLR